MTNHMTNGPSVPHAAGGNRTSGRRLALALTMPGGWWLMVGLTARSPWPLLRAWTDVGILGGLAITYAAAWAVIRIRSRATPRRVLLQASATTLTAGILVVLLELPAMMGLLSYAAINQANGIADAFVADGDLSFRRPPRFSWAGRVRSDLAESWNVPLASPKHVTFTTDAQGYRNPASRTAADVVLIGDSFIEGWYVSDDETAATTLERRLGRPVANLGVSGYGTLQELLVLRRDALPRQPRLVAWFFFEGNDLYDDQEFENTLLFLEDHDVEDLGFDLGVGVDWPPFPTRVTRA